ncbi:MAG: hypothetical protein DUD27_07075 [Lachnospiraceae bacterium]|nr:MAG: hypothetical protein DUD27_07075 [Lachnospiraceae bacterium]
MKIISDIIIISSIGVAIFWGGCCHKYDSYTLGLKRETNKKYRNLAAIFIVLHHGSSLFFNNHVLVVAFNNIGHLIVGLFFLWSGWGLGLKTLDEDFETNKKSFFKKSIVPLLIYTIIFNTIKILIFTGSKLYLGRQTVTYKLIIRQLLCLDLPDATEWYFIVLIAVYFTYWIIENIFSKRAVKTIIYLLLATTYIFFCWKTGKDGHWYISVIDWSIGYIFAVYNNNLRPMLDRKWKIKCELIGLIWLLTWIGVVANGKGSLNISKFGAMFITNISVICFALFITYLDSVYELGNYWIKYNDFSLGMYAIHPILLLGASYISKYIIYKEILFFGTLIILIPLSLIASRLFKKIKNIVSYHS